MFRLVCMCVFVVYGRVFGVYACTRACSGLSVCVCLCV